MTDTVQYRVQRRDTLTNIVRRLGFPARDWRRIYDASYNRSFRRRHPDPNLILPGAILNVPRYSPETLRDLLAKLDAAQDALGEAEAQMLRLQRIERQLRQTIARGPDDLRRLRQRIAELREAAAEYRARAKRARRLWASGRSLHADMLGAQAPRFEQTAERLDRQAAEMAREAERRSSDPHHLTRQLDLVHSKIAEAQRAAAALEARISALRTEHQRAARNPYR